MVLIAHSKLLGMLAVVTIKGKNLSVSFRTALIVFNIGKLLNAQVGF